MKLLMRYLTTIFILIVLMVSIGHPYQTKEGKTPLTSEERKIIRNQYGVIIQDARGERINYSRDQLDVQSIQSLKKSHPSGRSTGEFVTGPEPFWSYAAFGSCIGESNIILAPLGEHLEMYLGGTSSGYWGSNSFWHALYYNAAIGTYEQTYVSTYFPEGISRIKVADVIGDSGNEIVVALEDGRIQFYDQATKTWLAEVTTAPGLTDLEIVDVDNDGQNELIICTSGHLYVYSGAGILEWDMANVGGSDAVVGQMDDDSALEIAVTDGYVIDTAARNIQWHWANGFGAMLEAGDIDNDNRDELIAAENWYIIWSFDVERQLPKWSIPIDLDIGAIYLTDIDNDSVLELLVGEGQWGCILAYDTVTQLLEWSVDNPEHGVTNIAVGDIDGDDVTELIWGAGATSTGEDHLYVTNWQTAQIEWQNIHLDGPFIGPETGDLDGDGEQEIVTVSWESDSGYGSGRILVFDSNHHLRAISDEIVAGYAWTGTHDMQLYDVDQDGKKEILVAADWLYDGVIEIYDFHADNTFTLNWTNSTRPDGAPFYSAAAGDIDGDGQLEIVGGGGREHTGALGVYIYVYDYNTGSEEWHSLQMGSYWSSIGGVEIGDLDNDGCQEIIGMVNQGDVYIFNGVTKVLDTIIFGPFTALAMLNFDQTSPSFALGDADGNIKIYQDGTYQIIFDENYGTGFIHGISSNSTTGKQIFGSGGTLNIATTDGYFWTGPCYGTVFGKHPAFLSKTPAIYSSGSYSIAGFEYLPSITVTSPNGGEDWQEGTTETITWDTDGISGNLEITLWKDDILVGKIADGIGPSPGAYTWTVGQYIGGTAPAGTGYAVKIQETGTVHSDISDTYFTISGYLPPSITVTSPNGGENWPTGSTQTIAWTSEVLTGNVKIVLFKNGSMLGTIAFNIPITQGSYSWTTGNLANGTTVSPDTGYVIRVKSIDNKTYYDDSDGSFTISDDSCLTLTAPNGGETWDFGTSKTITWTSTGLTGNVKLILFINGARLGNIAYDIPGDQGSYSWTVGSLLDGTTVLPGTGYVVRVKSIENSSCYDDSNESFTISGLILTSPNGGENWALGTSKSITWASGGITGNVKLILFKNGTRIGNIAYDIPADQGSYSWTVGNLLDGSTVSPDTGYVVRVKSIENKTFFDDSDGGFTISDS